MFWLNKKDISGVNFILKMRELLGFFQNDEYREFFFNVEGDKKVNHDNLIG